MKPSEFAALTAAEIAVGGTHRTTCPTCRAPGKTFTVTRTTDGVLWNCFRDSCSAKGRKGSYSALDMRQPPIAPRETAYPGEIYSIDEADVAYFWQRFRITSKYSQKIRTAEDGAYLLPVLRPNGTQRGLVKRAPIWAGIEAPALRDYNLTPVGPDGPPPKTINYLESEKEVPLSWHIPDDADLVEHKHVILVEDIMSAMRIQSLGVTAIALLGSSLSDTRVRELQQAYRLKCTWAPDPDAIGTALKHTQKYGPAFQSLRVVFLDCDAKDYQDSDKLLDDLKVLQ
jgi:hypothetical protein